MAKLTRREFLKLFTGLAAAAGIGVVAGPIVAFFFPSKLEEMPSEPVLVGPVNELAVGKGKLVRFGRYPALIVHTPDGFRAYSAVCTHFACVCKWDEASERIVCPCHDGFFSAADGSVIYGPPPKGLTPLALTVMGEDLYVGGNA